MVYGATIEIPRYDFEILSVCLCGDHCLLNYISTWKAAYVYEASEPSTQLLLASLQCYPLSKIKHDSVFWV